MLFGKKKVTTSTDKDKIEELLSRGVDTVVEEEKLREKLLRGTKLRVKLGIDPTSPHIHLGRATQLLKLRDFQELGHTIVFIIGDATGVVGDTSDKDSERPMLTEKEVKENAARYFDQAGKILDMSLVEKHHNSTWLNKLTFAEIGRQANTFSVADFIARDNIKKRLDEGKRVSLRETLYPLMQGYDSVAIKSDVEIGGTDQWFNLLAGRTLQEEYKQEPQHVMTHTIIHGLDGRKMSSSWGNTINIEAEPNDMFGKVMSLKDDLMREYFISCTRTPLQKVEEILKGNPRDAKLTLAEDIVTLFYNKEVANKARESFIKTFAGNTVSEDAQEVLVKKGTPLVDVLVEHKIISSKNEFRRLLEGGAVTDMVKDEKITIFDFTCSEDIDLKVGKRRFIKIRVT